jgi:hypothetical protein
MSERNAVLAIARENARGGMSGASISSRIYTIFTFGEGKNARDQELYDEQPARKAVGLEE